MYRNNESVTPNPRSPLEDYSLHVIDLHTGRLCDTRSFKCDKIILSHNQGLYLYRNILAVLSVQQQTIHVFQVDWHAHTHTGLISHRGSCVVFKALYRVSMCCGPQIVFTPSKMPIL